MRAVLKGLCGVFGIALIAFGVIWVLQGLGMLDWPRGSFMYARSDWALYGAISAGIGVALLVLAGRLRR